MAYRAWGIFLGLIGLSLIAGRLLQISAWQGPVPSVPLPPDHVLLESATLHIQMAQDHQRVYGNWAQLLLQRGYLLDPDLMQPAEISTEWRVLSTVGQVHLSVALNGTDPTDVLLTLRAAAIPTDSVYAPVDTLLEGEMHRLTHAYAQRWGGFDPAR